MEWYDDLPHVGYAADGTKIMKQLSKDALDKFLSNGRTVYDALHGRDVVLSKEDMQLLRRIQNHQFPAGFDPHEPTIEWFTSEPEVMPISAAPEPKRRFIPSKHELRRIFKIARAIREGRLVPKKKETRKHYDIWTESGEQKATHIPAPRAAVPQHMESYNPPAEYLMTPEEEKEWEDMDSEDRQQNFVPKKHSSLRHVPGYSRFIQERFERCLDLYLCPRMIRQKLDIDPDSLLPKLPSAKDLEPYPSKLSITYEGHTGPVRSFAIDPTGQWLASGSEDHTVRIWEISTGRTVRSYEFSDKIMSVSWNPNADYCMLAIATDATLVFMSPGVCSADVRDTTREFLKNSLTAASTVEHTNVLWVKYEGKLEEAFMVLKFKKTVSDVCWHRKGDYFANVSADGTLINAASLTNVFIHQLARGQTQSPFKKAPGLVQKVLFHPSGPFFFVATQRYVRVYNLSKQELTKKLMPGARWISSIDVHPGGDNVIVGTYDKHVYWFDMDLSTKPYKTMRYHKASVRQVAFHSRYPLFASSSDDGSVLIFHGMVYSDLMQNPLIVPVKTLNAHAPVENLGILGNAGALDCKFHPTQPWIFSAGADNTLKLFV